MVAKRGFRKARIGWGFPSRTARRGVEKRLAKWWHHVTERKDKLDEEQLAAVKRMEPKANTTPVDVKADWESSCSMLEAWVRNAGRLPKQHAADAAEKNTSAVAEQPT